MATKRQMNRDKSEEPDLKSVKLKPDYTPTETTALKMDKTTVMYDRKFWGPYLSDRQWGTVREDNSVDGNCWDYFSHEATCSHVYRWGEDGLFGISDLESKLCAGLGLWNGVDPILKERLFGLTGPQGNHGEDVKELYYYLDNTPDHTYMKALYKYPHSEFPYEILKEENADRDVLDEEYEILDTGVFDSGYWDVTVEYAKDTAGSILCRYTVHNKSQNEATLHLIPQFWFRNTWQSQDSTESTSTRPTLSKMSDRNVNVDYDLGLFDIEFSVSEDGTCPQLLFTENEDEKTIPLNCSCKLLTVTSERCSITKKLGDDKTLPLNKCEENKTILESDENMSLCKTKPIQKTGDQVKKEMDSEFSVDIEQKKESCRCTTQHKDAFHKIVVQNQEIMDEKLIGTKCGALYRLTVPPGGCHCIYWTLYPTTRKDKEENLSLHVNKIMNVRKLETDQLYSKVIPDILDEGKRNVARQAYAGLLWNKQFYYYNVKQWRMIPTVDREKTTSQQEQNAVSEEETKNPHDAERDNSTDESKNVITDEVGDDKGLNGGDPDLVAIGNKPSDSGSDVTGENITTISSKLSQSNSSLDSESDLKSEDEESLESEPDFPDIDIMPGKYIPERRNKKWEHMENHDIVSMPDKWEFPWYASWDTAFQMIAFARIDPDFAKHQLLLFLSHRFMHPNGQIPAFEFDFGAANPPIHAWSCLKVFQTTGRSDFMFLKQCFHGLLQNFIWWKNNHDPDNLNLFTGGFLGLDNISVLDRGAPLPPGITLQQADATGWMALYSLNMLEICLELSRYEALYCDLCIRFLSHFVMIATTMNEDVQNGGLWCDKFGFYCDVLINSADSCRKPIQLKSLVGIIPAFACCVLKAELVDIYPEYLSYLNSLCEQNPDHVQKTSDGDYFLSAIPVNRLEIILKVLFTEDEFLSQYGVRSLSKIYEVNPFVFKFGKKKREVKYYAGESENRMFGGNSNWRGPIWLCMNYMIVNSLRTYYKVYGSRFKMVYPTNGHSDTVSLLDIGQDIARRIVAIFLSDYSGQRPLHGSCERYKKDSDWSDLLLFYEYFHGDTGRGCGASHQTGWTALITEFLHMLVD